MKYSEAKQGRIFVLRLEHGEIVHREIEKFAREKSVKAASLIVLGGADNQSRLVTGTEDGTLMPVTPMERILENVHEVAGTGTVFPDENGSPIVHMHMACGREETSITGCIRNGVTVWQVMEIVLYELADTGAKRVYDPATGFHLLEP